MSPGANCAVLRTIALEEHFPKPSVIEDKVFLFLVLCRLILLVYILFNETESTGHATVRCSNQCQIALKVSRCLLSICVFISSHINL